MSDTNDRGRCCSGPSRREVLRAGVLSGLGLTLDGWLRARAAGATATVMPTDPAARSCILIWLAGGPSHIDTFDPKPEAPSEYRGEFGAIDTALPGVQVSELFPRIAAMLDRMVLVRSMTSPEADHDRAAHHMLTGYRPSPAVVYPGYGSAVAKIRGQGAAGKKATTLPPFVAVPQAPAFASSGYLTSEYDPFAVGGDPSAPSFRVRDLTPPDRVTLDRLRRRRAMMERLDRDAAGVPETALTASRDRFTEQAYELLTSDAAQGAFRIDREPDAVRDRYGRTTLGQSCLLARRLVEAGVSFVTVTDNGGALGWDTHAQNFPTLKDRLGPPLDQAVSALIEDLARTGRLDQTLVLVMGEFGRTPRVNLNGGRDHHGRASSLLLAGGGLKVGQVIGRTDDRAEAPADRPVTPSDLAATVYQVLGIDPSQKLLSADGQPIRLVDPGQAIGELF
jgi:hypothetical protein